MNLSWPATESECMHVLHTTTIIVFQCLFNWTWILLQKKVACQNRRESLNLENASLNFRFLEVLHVAVIYFSKIYTHYRQ